MTGQSFSLNDFSPTQESRFRGYRYGLIGIWDIGRPRWMPNFRDIYLVVTMNEAGKPVRYDDSDGKQHWLPNGIFNKMFKAGLFEVTTPRTNAEGTAIIMSTWGLEFLIRGHTNRRLESDTYILRHHAAIMNTASVSLHHGANPPFILSETNSTLLVDHLDDVADASSIGFLVTPEATMAMAYNSEGLRITDVIIEHQHNAENDSWMRKFVLHPESREDPTKQDVEAAMRLASIFNVPIGRVFLDDSLFNDIIQRRCSIHRQRNGITPEAQIGVNVKRPQNPLH